MLSICLINLYRNLFLYLVQLRASVFSYKFQNIYFSLLYVIICKCKTLNNEMLFLNESQFNGLQFLLLHL